MKEISFKIRKNYEQNRKFCVVKVETLDTNRFTDITDNELERIIRPIVACMPNAGETYIKGSLRSRGINIPRRRLREQLNIIDPIGRELRKRKPIKRRVYNVKGPNHLW